ncbi:MAG: nucleotidyltransferase family protein [Clostridia bacterium]|nr:nucleotidyltransferase family protein [Clostridia bacterium]
MEKKTCFDVILSCLRFAIWKEPISEEIRALISGDLFAEIYHLSEKQDLAHLVGFALKENGLLPKDHPLAPSFEKKIIYALFRTERIEHHRIKLCSALEQAGLEHIALKGAVVRNFYPETWMRTSSDADVLVREECLEQAIALLLDDLGYTLKERSDHDLSFTAPGGENMELHFDLVGENLMPDAEKILRRVWEMTLPCGDKAYEKKLSPEFFLFYHIAHMAKHINNGGIGIRFFLDYQLLRAKMKVDEKKYKELLGLSHLDTFERAASELCKLWFEKGEKTEKALLLQDFDFSAGIFGEQKNFVAVRRGEMGKLTYLKSRIFASYETLCRTYPNLEGKRYLIPYYQFRRLIDHFRYVGFHKTVSEAKQNLSMPSEDGEKMARLLKEMDLKFYN